MSVKTGIIPLALVLTLIGGTARSESTQQDADLKEAVAAASMRPVLAYLDQKYHTSLIDPFEKETNGDRLNRVKFNDEMRMLEKERDSAIRPNGTLTLQFWSKLLNLRTDAGPISIDRSCFSPPFVSHLDDITGALAVASGITGNTIVYDRLRDIAPADFAWA